MYSILGRQSLLLMSHPYGMLSCPHYLKKEWNAMWGIYYSYMLLVLGESKVNIFLKLPQKRDKGRK